MLDSLPAHFGGHLRTAPSHIDAAIGDENHARAALVAIYEGIDTLLQASFDIAESVLCEKVFERLHPTDPLGAGEPLAAPDSPKRLAIRLTRASIENGAVRVASAGDHLANAHIRLAWEANAATAEEVLECGFDPSRPDPVTWSSVPQLRGGLRAVRKLPLGGVLAAFELNAAFRAYMSAPGIIATRRYRDEVVHRARPGHRESPSYGRTSKWVEGKVTVTHPFEPPTAGLPSLDERRRLVNAAAAAALKYGQSTWDLALRWLRTIDVWIIRTDEEVRVETRHGGRTPRFPREQRDPGPFLNAT
jgi:hypothetical protein